MRILAVIPARKGSKRLPGKNLLPLAGKPLVQWSIERAFASSVFVDVLVSTDNPVILDLARGQGALAPWLRPENLSNDAASTEQVLQHALGWYEQEYGDVDALALLQPTSPFRTVETIRTAVAEFAAQPADDVRAIVSVSPVAQHPAWCFRVKHGEMMPLLSWNEVRTKSQDLEQLYSLNGALYLFPAESVRAACGLIPGCRAYVMNSQQEALDIDTDLHFALAEIYAAKGM